MLPWFPCSPCGEVVVVRRDAQRSSPSTGCERMLRKLLRKGRGSAFGFVSPIRFGFKTRGSRAGLGSCRTGWPSRSYQTFQISGAFTTLEP